MSLIDALSETNSKATDLGEKYFKASYRYYKLKLFQQLSVAIGLVFKTMVIGGVLFLCVGFLAVASALFLGELLESYAMGFTAVGVFFVICFLIAYMAKSHINNLAVRKLSKKIFN